jgi:NusA-like KH domain protein
MAGVIDMKLMRYINLFSKVSRVDTTNCFIYNGQIIFAVPKDQVSMAIGKDASNIRQMREILGKKIRVVAMPNKENREELAEFVGEVVDPIEFNKIEVKEGSVTITAGRQSKAALIGRDRTREKELFGILKDHFGIRKFRIA